MSKKEVKEETWVSSLISNITVIAKEFLLHGVLSRFHEELDIVLEKVESRSDSAIKKLRSTLDNFREHFMQDFTFRVMFLAGILFIIFGIIYGMTDILKVPRTYAFIIIGVVLMIVMFFYKKFIDIKKRHKEEENAKEKSCQKKSD